MHAGHSCTGGSVTDAEPLVPSAKVAVTVKTEPGTKRSRRSAAKRMAAPLSGRVKERAPSEAFRSGPSSEAATPRTQKGLSGSVSQMPFGPARRSSSCVTARGLAPGARVRKKVPSRAPSGLRAVLSWPTRSRTLPIKARDRAGGVPMVVDAEAVVPSAKVAGRGKTEPGAKRAKRTAAQRMAPLPSGKVRETVPSAALRSGPSREAATPRTQYWLRVLVSQMPMGPVRRSSSRVRVRGPAPGARVKKKAPSRAPSGPKTARSWPTRSRILPAKARVIAGVEVPRVTVTLSVALTAAPTEPASPLVGPVLLAAGAALPSEKVAVTVTGALPAMTQGSVPVQPPPLQPLKNEPPAGVAVRVSTVPTA